MAHRIVWSRRAFQDLEAIAKLHCGRLSRLRRRCDQENYQSNKVLEHFPQSGRKAPEFDDDRVRELLVYSYRVIYRIQQDEIGVAAVIHGKKILQ